MKQLQPDNWDRDKVWNNIEKELHKKKKRRGLLWLWFGSGSLLAILLFILWFSPGSNLMNTKGLPATSDHLIERNIPKNRTAQKSISKDDEQPELIKPLLPNKMANQKAQQQAMKTPVSKPINIPEALKANTVATKDQLKKEESLPMSNSTPTAVHPIEQALLPLPSQEEIKDQKAKIYFLAPPFNPIVYQWPLDQQKALARTAQHTTNPTSAFYLRFLSSFSMGNVQYLGAENWKTAKERSESFEFASKSTIGLDWYFTKNSYLYSGLSYQIIRSRYDFTTTQTMTRLIESDSALVYDLGNELVYESGFLEETSTIRRSIIHNNTLRRFSIPLGLGYTKSIGRFQLEARAGIHFQWIQTFNGIALDENSNLHILNEQAINERYFSDHLKLGFNSAFLVNYQIKPRSSIFIGLQYEQDGKASKTRIPFQSTYQFWGLQLGWKRQL